MKNGWLIVNGFLKNSKFDEIYNLLCCASKEYDINLSMKTNVELVDILESDEIFNKPDFVLFYDKDVRLAEKLQLQGIKLINSAEAIENSDDKSLTALKLLEHKIPHPKTIIAPKTFQNIGYTSLDFIDIAIQKLGLPLVIKESFGSFGKQVYLAKDKSEAIGIISNLGCKPFIMQEFIDTSHGKDVRINVVGDKVVSSMLRYNEDDFRSNVSNGAKMKNYTPSPIYKELAVKACKALGLDFGGVDVLFGKNDTPIICEVNSNLHFKSTLTCTGDNVANHIMEYINDKIL